MEEPKHIVSIRAAKRLIIFEIASHFKEYLPDRNVCWVIKIHFNL